MWKKSDKLKKTKLKFKTEEAIQEFSRDLQTLHELEIIDYKVVNEKGFTVCFSKKFVDYYNIHHDRLKVSSIENMMGAMKQFPEEFEMGKKPSDDQFASMFYSTLVISFLNDTKLIEKVNPGDMNLIGRLIITVEQLKDMMVDEDTKGNEFK